MATTIQTSPGNTAAVTTDDKENKMIIKQHPNDEGEYE
jgi:hypothetical protein